MEASELQYPFVYASILGAVCPAASHSSLPGWTVHSNHEPKQVFLSLLSFVMAMKINNHRDMMLRSQAIAAVSLVTWSLDLWNWLVAGL